MSDRDRDRDRLANLIDEYFGVDAAYFDVDKYELADYLLSNSVIVPPCKVGDTVYELHDYYSIAKGHHTVIEGHTVTGLVYMSERSARQWVVCCWGGYRFDNCDFGETVFLTPEGAVQALKERKERK